MNQISTEADWVLKYANQTNQSIFLTGKAGTGKTTLLRELVASTHKNVAVVAPTGIAALNAKGVTIHSLFLLPFATFVPDDDFVSEHVRTENRRSLKRHFHFRSEKKRLIQALELLIVDEVSMLRADVLDAMDFMLRVIRRNNLPFGGVQLIFIGDLLQLPPVVKSEEWNVLQQFYQGIYFFNAKVLQDYPPVYIELDKVFRQTDHEFLDILNAIRENKINNKHLSILQKYVNPKFDIRKNKDTLVLTTHNHKADKINHEALAAIEEKEYVFEAETVEDFPERLYPMEHQLRLKKGAKVMFIKNDISFEKKYYNGKIGIVHEINPSEIKVRFPEDNETIEVDKYEWQNIRYSVNKNTKEIEEKILGTFTQYPLRLAWAITVHKSQGLTFDRAAIDLKQVFASGQLYVALSRLRSLNGLILLDNINNSLLIPNREVADYAKNKPDEQQLEQYFNHSAAQYLYENLLNSFTWNDFQLHWKKFTDDLQFSGGSDKKKQYAVWAQKQYESIADLVSNGAKFVKQLKIKFAENPQAMDYFQQRVFKAYEYFFPRWDALYFELLHNLELSKRQKGMKTLVEDLTELDSEMLDIMLRLDKINQWLKALSENQTIDKTTLYSADKAQIRLNHLVEIKQIITKNHLHFEDDIYEEDQPKKKPKKDKKPTIDITFELWSQKLSIDEIARERKLTEGTIYGHLSKLVEAGKIDINDLLPSDLISKMQIAYDQNEISDLSALRNAVNDDNISWDELRLFMKSQRANHQGL